MFNGFLKADITELFRRNIEQADIAHLNGFEDFAPFWRS
jgi:hypothetical protein